MNVFCCSYEIRMALKNVRNRAGSNIKKNFRGNINHRKFVYTGAIFFFIMHLMFGISSETIFELFKRIISFRGEF